MTVIGSNSPRKAFCPFHLVGVTGRHLPGNIMGWIESEPTEGWREVHAGPVITAYKHHPFFRREKKRRAGNWVSQLNGEAHWQPEKLEAKVLPGSDADWLLECTGKTRLLQDCRLYILYILQIYLCIYICLYILPLFLHLKSFEII